MADRNKSRHSQQNRQDNWEDLNANINYSGNIDNPDSGFVSMDERDKGRISREINTHKEEVASPKDLGAISGRQDLAGGAGDKTETSGYAKDTRDTRGGAGTGDPVKKTKRQINKKSNRRHQP